MSTITEVLSETTISANKLEVVVPTIIKEVEKINANSPKPNSVVKLALIIFLVFFSFYILFIIMERKNNF